MQNVLKCYRVQIILRNYAKKAAAFPQNEMKYLNVAEKHDAAKTIAGLLSNGASRRREGYSKYNKIFDFETNVRGNNAKMVMTSVSGHLLHLEFLSSYRNWRNIDPKALFDAPVRKACSEDYQPIKRTLEREVRGCQGLIIWTDCDREGENIGYEIIEVCRAIKPNITVHRAIFSEITAVAVRRALQQLKTPDKRQSDAVDIRTELDLRTGAAITRFQTLRLQRIFPEKIADKLISYGSCQIPTLGFVAERYKEIEAFVSEPFWKIKVLHTIDELTVEFLWARNRLFDKQACEDYYLLCIAEPQATVESVTVKPKHKWRPTPMDTVEMEKLGSRKLKLSAKETMTIAEKLYTKGIISYPRTETNQFSKEFDLRPLVEQQTGHSVWGEFAQRVMEWGPNPRNGNKSDQAHPPIHPTKLVTNLDGNEARVYELIVRHFLACVSKDAVGSETVVHINIAGEKFHGNGLVIYERNYLDVYVYEKWNAKEIHKYEVEQVFEPTEITMPEGATTAPPLLTEADLIALMEKHGIGTDATHAEHINTIKERGYIGVVDKGGLVPGVIGMGLYEGYDAMELTLAKPLLRAEFEADLKRICLGEKDPKQVLREQIVKYKSAYQQITEKITAMDAKIAERLNETPRAATTAAGEGQHSNLENNAQIQELFQCPKCNVTPLALKPKKNQGFYIGCLNFPDCKNTIWIPDEWKEPQVLENECCQKCGDGFKLLKFKFNTAFYRTKFCAPHGWYKTCLRCDAQLRHTFDINLDKVKRVGGIVSEAAAQSSGNNINRQQGNIGGSAPSNRVAGNGSATNNRGNGAAQDKKQPKTKKPNGDNSTQTLDKPKRATKTNTNTKRKPSTDTKPTSIRNYFTNATSSTNSTSNVAALAAEQLRDVPLDEFFDSNDGFDDILLAAEANICRANSGNDNRNIANAAGLTDDIAAAFAADDDDADFADFDWNTAGSGDNDDPPGPPPPAAISRVTTALSNNGYNFEDSFSNVFREDEDDIGSFAWGTKARATQGTGSTPAAKRPCLQAAAATVPNRTRFFNDDYDDENDAPEPMSWGTQSRRSIAPPPSQQQQENVKCSGCHQAAKSLTAKREGPNQGRLFYVCPKNNNNNPCKFFQWADETGAPVTEASQRSNSGNHATSSNSWGTTTNSNSWSSSANNAASHSSNFTSDGTVIECNCGKPASSLTVRKDGPNKGRPFYACPVREKSCGFFKWGDEDADNQASTSNSSWGSGARRKEDNTNSNQNTKGGSKGPRKCGLCRQEGHTKNKCPRKSEFEY